MLGALAASGHGDLAADAVDCVRVVNSTLASQAAAAGTAITVNLPADAGQIDLVSGNAGAGDLTVLHNDGGSFFGSTISLGAAPSCLTIC